MGSILLKYSFISTEEDDKAHLFQVLDDIGQANLPFFNNHIGRPDSLFN